MTGKMVDQRNGFRCKYHNSGFCRYGNVCKFFHATLICRTDNCRERKCPSRHPKECRYKSNCRRKTYCLYKHDNDRLEINDFSAKYRKVEAYNNTLISEIEVLKENVTSSHLKLTGVKDSLQQSFEAEKHALNVKCQEIEVINNTLIAEVETLKAGIKTAQLKHSMVEKFLKAAQAANESSKQLVKSVTAENIKLKNEKRLLKTEIEAVKKEVSQLKLKVDITDLAQKTDIKDKTIENKSTVDIVTLKLSKVGCSITPVLQLAQNNTEVKCDKCDFKAFNSESMTTHAIIKHKQEDTQLSCKLCAEKFEKEDQLITHSREIH